MYRTRSAAVSSDVGAVITWRPSRRTVARPHSSNTSSRRWLTNRTATPRSRVWRTMANSRSTSCAESDAVGSSRMRTRASIESALAISISCWSAIERPRTIAEESMLTLRLSKMRSADRRIARQLTEPNRPVRAWPMNTFSATVRSGNRRGSWWTVAMPSERACAGPWISTGLPSSITVPESGWWMPASTLTTVLLPAPFSPTSPWISPGSRSSETSESAWVAANRFDTAASATGGGALVTATLSAAIGLASLITGSPVRSSQMAVGCLATASSRGPEPHEP